MERLFANDMTDKGLLFSIYKQLIQLHPQKANNPFKNERNIWIDIFPKKRYRWPTAHEKMLSITNHQGNANLNHSELLPIIIRMAIIKNVGKNMEKKEPLYTVGRNVN